MISRYVDGKREYWGLKADAPEAVRREWEKRLQAHRLSAAAPPSTPQVELASGDRADGIRQTYQASLAVEHTKVIAAMRGQERLAPEEVAALVDGILANQQHRDRIRKQFSLAFANEKAVQAFVQFANIDVERYEAIRAKARTWGAFGLGLKPSKPILLEQALTDYVVMWALLVRQIQGEYTEMVDGGALGLSNATLEVIHTTRRNVLALAATADEVLDRYITVHDALYAGSPVKKLFSRIEFGTHARQLHTMVEELAAVRQQAINSRAGELADGPSAAFIDEFIPYLHAVMDAESRLERICQGLDSNTRLPGSYDSRTYKRDTEGYKAAVALYQYQGASLNPLFDALCLM